MSQFTRKLLCWQENNRHEIQLEYTVNGFSGSEVIRVEMEIEDTDQPRPKKTTRNGNKYFDAGFFHTSGGNNQKGVESLERAEHFAAAYADAVALCQMAKRVFLRSNQETCANDVIMALDSEIAVNADKGKRVPHEQVVMTKITDNLFVFEGETYNDFGFAAMTLDHEVQHNRAYTTVEASEEVAWYYQEQQKRK